VVVVNHLVFKNKKNMVNLNIDIDIEEFLESCNDRNIREIINFLEENGDIPKKFKETSNLSINEIEFKENLDVISLNYLNLDKDAEEMISVIAKRFK
jgi:hypothetical protein